MNTMESGEAGFIANIAITGTTSVDLRTLADAADYDGVQDATVSYTLADGVALIGNAGINDGGAGGDAIDTGVWPVGPTIILTLSIDGAVRSGGGAGGSGSFSTGDGFNGGFGGDAINCQEDIDITVNPTGIVEAAGGGGGGGGGGFFTFSQNGFPTGGGGGGGGYPNGGFGSGGGGTIQGQPGQPGTLALDGEGGGRGGTAAVFAGAGGAGGDVATDASDGSPGQVGAGFTNGGLLGTAGFAIRFNGNTVNVVNNGGSIKGTTA